MENFIQLQHKELEVRVIESKERQENIKAKSKRITVLLNTMIYVNE